jgi:5-oxopent-3-ene-1,2,5-tricarboxylate decarboxylase/2-hydroxyhepta-2,4-diene-1,7-dioate isomerase
MDKTANLARRLREVPTSDAKDMLADHGLLRVVMTGVRRMTGKQSIAGPARTLRMLPLREDLGAAPNGPLNRQFIDSAVADEVLAIDAMGAQRGAVLGDMMATRLRYSGVAGVVTDGPIRDRVGIDRVGLPVFASGTDPDANRHWVTPWESDVAIQCGGVLVLPGDWIMADDDAVVVIPAGLAESIADQFEARKPREAFSQALLKAGHPLQESYPLPEARLADLDAFLASGTVPPRSS